MSANTIGPNDLENVIKIIDAVVERGAIKGAEIYQVGQVRERFASLYKMATEAQPTQPTLPFDKEESENH